MEAFSDFNEIVEAFGLEMWCIKLFVKLNYKINTLHFIRLSLSHDFSQPIRIGSETQKQTHASHPEGFHSSTYFVEGVSKNLKVLYFTNFRKGEFRFKVNIGSTLFSEKIKQWQEIINFEICIIPVCVHCILYSLNNGCTKYAKLMMILWR